MKVYFDIPPKEHRGWSGDASVTVSGRHVIIDPCGASGSINGGHNHRYSLELGFFDILKILWLKLKISLTK